MHERLELAEHRQAIDQRSSFLYLEESGGTLYANCHNIWLQG